MSAPVFDNQPMTKREVLIAREAAAKMRCAVQHEADESDTGKGADWQRHTHACFACQQRAAECYPLPKVTRPREVTDRFGQAWRVGLDALGNPCVERRDRNHHDGWSQDAADKLLTPDRVALWADLLANPTEEVEDAS